MGQRECPRSSSEAALGKVCRIDSRNAEKLTALASFAFNINAQKTGTKRAISGHRPGNHPTGVPVSLRISLIEIRSYTESDSVRLVLGIGWNGL